MKMQNVRLPTIVYLKKTKLKPPKTNINIWNIGVHVFWNNVGLCVLLFFFPRADEHIYFMECALSQMYYCHC